MFSKIRYSIFTKNLKTLFAKVRKHISVSGLAFKVGGLKKKCAIRPRLHSNQSAGVRTRAKSNHSQSLMAGIFAALWPIKPKFSALKDLNPFRTVSKAQEASNILRVGFALSKWPHFNSIYLVRVPFLTGIAVCLNSPHFDEINGRGLL